MSEAPPKDKQFVVDMQFKPTEPGQKLRPAEARLFLSYIGEILGEIEVEERHIIEEEKRAAREVTARNFKKEAAPCK